MTKNQLSVLRYIPALPTRIPAKLDVDLQIRWRW